MEALERAIENLDLLIADTDSALNPKPMKPVRGGDIAPLFGGGSYLTRRTDLANKIIRELDYAVREGVSMEANRRTAELMRVLQGIYVGEFNRPDLDSYLRDLLQTLKEGREELARRGGLSTGAKPERKSFTDLMLSLDEAIDFLSKPINHRARDYYSSTDYEGMASDYKLDYSDIARRLEVAYRLMLSDGIEPEDTHERKNFKVAFGNGLRGEYSEDVEKNRIRLLPIFNDAKAELKRQYAEADIVTVRIQQNLRPSESLKPEVHHARPHGLERLLGWIGTFALCWEVYACWHSVAAMLEPFNAAVITFGSGLFGSCVIYRPLNKIFVPRTEPDSAYGAGAITTLVALIVGVPLFLLALSDHMKKQEHDGRSQPFILKSQSSHKKLPAGGLTEKMHK